MHYLYSLFVFYDKASQRLSKRESLFSLVCAMGSQLLKALFMAKQNCYTKGGKSVSVGSSSISLVSCEETLTVKPLLFAWVDWAHTLYQL